MSCDIYESSQQPVKQLLTKLISCCSLFVQLFPVVGGSVVFAVSGGVVVLLLLWLLLWKNSRTEVVVLSLIEQKYGIFGQMFQRCDCCDPAASVVCTNVKPCL